MWEVFRRRCGQMLLGEIGVWLGSAHFESRCEDVERGRIASMRSRPMHDDGRRQESSPSPTPSQHEAMLEYRRGRGSAPSDIPPAGAASAAPIMRWSSLDYSDVGEGGSSGEGLGAGMEAMLAPAPAAAAMNPMRPNMSADSLVSLAARDSFVGLGMPLAMPIGAPLPAWPLGAAGASSSVNDPPMVASVPMAPPHAVPAPVAEERIEEPTSAELLGNRRSPQRATRGNRRSRSEDSSARRPSREDLIDESLGRGKRNAQPKRHHGPMADMVGDDDEGLEGEGAGRGSLQVNPWTPSEDNRILRGVRENGCRWSLIALTLPGRSDNAVRNRWHRLERAERARREAHEEGRAIEGYRCRKCGQFKKGHMCPGLEPDGAAAAAEGRSTMQQLSGGGVDGSREEEIPPLRPSSFTGLTGRGGGLADGLGAGAGASVFGCDPLSATVQHATALHANLQHADPLNSCGAFTVNGILGSGDDAQPHSLRHDGRHMCSTSGGSWHQPQAMLSVGSATEPAAGAMPAWGFGSGSGGANGGGFGHDDGLGGAGAGGSSSGGLEAAGAHPMDQSSMGADAMGGTGSILRDGSLGVVLGGGGGLGGSCDGGHGVGSSFSPRAGTGIHTGCSLPPTSSMPSLPPAGADAFAALYQSGSVFGMAAAVASAHLGGFGGSTSLYSPAAFLGRSSRTLLPLDSLPPGLPPDVAQALASAFPHGVPMPESVPHGAPFGANQWTSVPMAPMASSWPQMMPSGCLPSGGLPSSSFAAASPLLPPLPLPSLQALLSLWPHWSASADVQSHPSLHAGMTPRAPMMGTSAGDGEPSARSMAAVFERPRQWNGPAATEAARLAATDAPIARPEAVRRLTADGGHLSSSSGRRDDLSDCGSLTTAEANESGPSAVRTGGMGGRWGSAPAALGSLPAALSVPHFSSGQADLPAAPVAAVRQTSSSSLAAGEELLHHLGVDALASWLEMEDDVPLDQLLDLRESRLERS